jgi:DNA-binding MarR family transcriptional regulator
LNTQPQRLRTDNQYIAYGIPMGVRQGRTRWLTAAEQRAWLAYLDGTFWFFDALDHAHDENVPLSLREYNLMVQLSGAPNRTRRMSELADGLVSSRSRITHTVERLEERGLVTRSPADRDRRGINCTMTGAGYDLLVASAPFHVAAVRRLMVDALTREEFLALGSAMSKVAEASRAEIALRAT